ncbi:MULTISPECIES: response regulator transcription factor [unclassified Streptomyces]|uniref:winged helix-turn-helix transcriptional regulator n=1 Tax=unclassified Streptomyces TaxID=2593676 RepID=UPI0024A87B71|nr:MULTISPECIES: response regulator transcription factor [unclassified Streptomyces]
MTPDAHRPPERAARSGPEDAQAPDLLLAEPDEELAKQVVARFSAAGLRTVVCRDGAQALLEVGALRPRAVLLSAPLPVVGAQQVAELIAKLHPVPVIVGAGPDGVKEATAAVAAGAVAFVARPYRAQEVLTLLKGSEPSDGSESTVVVGDVELDVAGFHVYVRGRSVQLPVREFLLLRYFMERPNKVISRAELTQALWGSDKLDSNTLTVHIRRVRNKIQEAGGCCTIGAIRGMGYRFECSPTGSAGAPGASSGQIPSS